MRAAPSAVWDSLVKTETLAAWVPGARSAAWTAEDRIEAVVEQSLIGFKVLMEVTLAVTSKEAPRRIVLRGRGHDGVSGSTVDFELRVALSPAAAGDTDVTYETDATLAGKLENIGDFVLRLRAKEIHKQLAASVKRALEA